MNKRDAIRFGTVVSSRDNNLDLIRFVSAIAVIWSHSFSLTQGPHSLGAFLDQWTDQRLSFGGMAVAVFFLYGGILIAKSCESHPDTRKFFIARCQRIFPQLIFIVLFSTFVWGGVLTTLSITDYLTNGETYRYLLNAILIPVHTLPGVFTFNPYPEVVNGSLWTLPVEFAAYILCYLIFRLTAFRKKTYIWTIIVVIACAIVYFAFFHLYMLSVVRAVLEFYIGVCLWVWRDKIILRPSWGILSIFATIVLCYFGWDIAAMLVTFPYACLWLGWGTRRKFSHFAKYGEFSYGIYLWAFPLQQTLVFLWPTPMHWAVNASLISLIAICGGIFNYHVIDKPVMNMVRRRRKITASTSHM
ncbi:acyltransferase family protein [Schaalia sp. lx-100]|uniref:acyltransferase family protein n=1 Tax=Schaalia sp. lx-100 TaxID=2899081 RepID=UPI001E59D2AF|nr:acyltransferase [Schaalia sp. lx-100]MCD4556759.1 acyltransferase [Schaalia sp. lx-100]